MTEYEIYKVCFFIAGAIVVFWYLNFNKEGKELTRGLSWLKYSGYIGPLCLLILAGLQFV